MKHQKEYGPNYRKFRAAWYIDGHRLHKYDDIHTCWYEACAYSEEHPRTEVIIIEWIERYKDYRCMAVIKDNLSQPNLRLKINNEGVFNNGTENRND
jgi:hypothetical protein